MKIGRKRREEVIRACELEKREREQETTWENWALTTYSLRSRKPRNG